MSVSDNPIELLDLALAYAGLTGRFADEMAEALLVHLREVENHSERVSISSIARMLTMAMAHDAAPNSIKKALVRPG